MYSLTVVYGTYKSKRTLAEKFLCVTFALMLLSYGAAQDFGLCPDPKSQSASADAAPEQLGLQNPLDLLSKVNFGAAVGVSLLGQPNIEAVSAEPIVDGSGETQFITRVDREERFRRQFWLESHYLINYTCVWQRPIAHGPFVALNLLSDNGGLFNAFALGYLVSFKQSADPADSSALNIGLGLQSSSITTLGDGIIANEPLPPGIENVRTKVTDSLGLVLIVSFTFFAP